MNNNKTFLAVLISSIIAGNVSAKDQSTIESQITFYHQKNKNINDLGHTVIVVDRDDIMRQANMGYTLNQILSFSIPGLDVGSGSKTNVGQNMRGRSAVVMIDGIQLNHKTKRLSRHFASINPFSIERIEVISGANAIYGGSGAGGIINIITKKGENTQGNFEGETLLSHRSGFADQHDYHGSIAQSFGGGSEQGSLYFSAAYDMTGGFYDANQNILPTRAQGDNNESKGLDNLLTGQLNLNTNQSISLLAHYYDVKQNDTNIYGNKVEDGNKVYTKGFINDRPQETQQVHLQASFNDQAFWGQELTISTNFRQEHQLNNPYLRLNKNEIVSSSSGVFDFESYDMQISLNRQIGDLNVAYGGELMSETLNSHQFIHDLDKVKASHGLVHQTQSIDINYHPNMDSLSTAGYLQLDYSLTPVWGVSGGYRYEYTLYDINDFNGHEGGEVSFDASVFNAELIFKPFDNQTAWLNFSQNLDLPDVAKQARKVMRKQDLNHNKNNVDKIKGIHVNSFELGYRYKSKAFQTQVTAYHSRQDQELTTQTDPDTKDKNLVLVDNKQYIYGIEGQLNVDLNKNWFTGTSFNYVRTRIKKKDGNWELPSIDYTSIPSAQYWVGWQNNNLNIRFQGQSVANLTDKEGTTLKGYTVFDVSLKYDLDKYGAISIGIKNLLNNEAKSIFGQRVHKWYGSDPYQIEGRTYQVNYQYQF